MRDIQGLGVPLLAVIAMAFTVWQVNDRYRGDLDGIRQEVRQSVTDVDRRLGEVGVRLEKIAVSLEQVVDGTRRDREAVELRSSDRLTRGAFYVWCLRNAAALQTDKTVCADVFAMPPFALVTSLPWAANLEGVK